MKNAKYIYNVLLKLYPPGFRKAFGAEMMQTFMDNYRDVEKEEGCVSMAFWLSVISDEIRNMGGQYMAFLMEGNTFLRISPPKLVLSGILLLPLYAVFYAVLVRTSLALPHPPLSGISVLIAFATLFLLSGVLSMIASYVFASALTSIFPMRKAGNI